MRLEEGIRKYLCTFIPTHVSLYQLALYCRLNKLSFVLSILRLYTNGDLGKYLN